MLYIIFIYYIYQICYTVYILHIIWYPLKPSLSQAPSAMHVTHTHILPRRDKLNVKTTLTLKTSGHLKCSLNHFPFHKLHSLARVQPPSSSFSSLTGSNHSDCQRGICEGWQQSSHKINHRWRDKRTRF